MEIIVLGLLNLVILGVHAWYIRNHQRQEKMMIKALLSKDLNDFTSSELAEKPVKQKGQESDYIALSEIDDESFDKAIKRTLNAK